MSALILLLAVAAPANSPFEGRWACRSAFEDKAYQLRLVVESARSTATISDSNDEHVPNGAVSLYGSPQHIEHFGSDPNNFYPELRWDGTLTNPRGWMSFSLRWDDQAGLLVSLWQYNADRSPSSFAGELVCEELTQ